MEHDPNGNFNEFNRCIAKRCRAQPVVGTPEGCYCIHHYAEREEQLEREFLATHLNTLSTPQQLKIFDYGNE